MLAISLRYTRVRALRMDFLAQFVHECAKYELAGGEEGRFDIFVKMVVLVNEFLLYLAMPYYLLVSSSILTRTFTSREVRKQRPQTK